MQRHRSIRFRIGYTTCLFGMHRRETETRLHSAAHTRSGVRRERFCPVNRPQNSHFYHMCLYPIGINVYYSCKTKPTFVVL